MMELEPVIPHTNRGMNQDLDLIEVLWRQDIDLGVGKEVFDVNLRRELEREREVELQKERQKQKELELLQKKAEEEERQRQQRWRNENFTQDGETGEWIQIGHGRVPPPPAVTSPEGIQNFLFSNENLLNDTLAQDQGRTYTTLPPQVTNIPPSHHHPPHQHYQQQIQNVPLPASQGAPPMYGGQGCYNQSHSGYNQNQMHNYNQTQHRGHNFTNQMPPNNGNFVRQESLDQRWQDLVNLLELPPNDTNNHSNFTAPLPPQHNQPNCSMMMNNMNNMSMSSNGGMPQNMNMNMMNANQNMGSAVDNSSVLIQNATLPAPSAPMNNLTGFNNSGMTSPAHSHDAMSPTGSAGMMSPPQSYNSSVPSGESLGPLDWETSPSCLFPNVTTNLNETESLESVGELLPDFITDEDLVEGINFSEMELNDSALQPSPSDSSVHGNTYQDDMSSDSAVSMGSPDQDSRSDSAMSPFDGVEGATGGRDYDRSPDYSKTSKYDPDEFSYSNSCSFGRSDGTGSNYSSSSNDTDYNNHLSPPNGNNNHIHHNHTYPLQPGADPKDIKKYQIKDRQPKHKGPHCRDAKRILELKVPFTVDQIVDTPVEEFNEMLTRHKLTDAQLQLVRDIRRRGKNKVAAQNCRKRKMDVIYTLEDEMTHLKNSRERLLHERHLIDKQTREMKEKFSSLYREIFSSLRDEHGRPYDPARYSLQQSSDGDVFLVPRNVTAEDQEKSKKKKNDQK